MMLKYFLIFMFYSNKLLVNCDYSEWFGEKFFLYPDPWNPDYYQELKVGDSKSLLKSKYNKWNFPIILIHGISQNYSTNFPQLTKDAYLKKRINANIILVDWSNFNGKYDNNIKNYEMASFKSELIGKKIAKFVIFLINHGYLYDPTRVHLIGFSIGAHIAGIAGQQIRMYTHKPIQRITGLDPAGPLFQYHPLKGKILDHTDAYFVDIVHTNQGRYGYVGGTGHVDFFPNGGGPEQPGCTHYSDLKGLPGSCAHQRAWEYFTESILGTEIWACKSSSYKEYQHFSQGAECLDKALFGVYVSPSVRGGYYFDIVRHDPVLTYIHQTNHIDLLPQYSNKKTFKQIIKLFRNMNMNDTVADYSKFVSWDM